MTVTDAASRPEALAETDTFECLNFVLHGTGEDESQCWALPMTEVREIIRVPRLSAIPLSGRHLMGVTNLRGGVLPVASLGVLVGLEPAEETKTSRILVLRGETPLGLWVDAVERVEAVPIDRLDRSELTRGRASHALLAGFVRPGEEEAPVRRLLSAEAVIAASTCRPRAEEAGSGAGASGPGAAGAVAENTQGNRDQYIRFDLADQAYALNIRQIKEVVRPPRRLESVAGMPDHLLGVMPLRQLMVPLLALSRLYGLTTGEAGTSRECRVIVVPVGARDGTEFVGLMVDRVRQVVTPAPDAVQPVPESLGAEGIEDISAMIQTGDRGQELTAVLDARKLLAQETFQEAARAADNTEVAMTNETDQSQDRQLVVFSLDGEEYGVAIESAKEIVRLPEKLTRVPQAEDFIEGVINLRGMVLPVIDLRRRFGLATMERDYRQRIVVLNLDGRRTGFIVDAVREVLRVPTAAVEAAPPLSPEQSTLVTEVANLTEAERLILMLDIQRLVSEQEARRLAQLDDTATDTSA